MSCGNRFLFLTILFFLSEIFDFLFKRKEKIDSRIKIIIIDVLFLCLFFARTIL